jgi:hypothetical protein
MSIRSVVGSGRRLVATTLLDRARIRDRTLVRDTTGGTRETFVERPRTIACRFVMPKSDDPVLNVDSVFGPTTMTLLMPLGTLFDEGDRVFNLGNSMVYIITKDVTVPSELGVISRAGIRQVD